ncbi:MAG: endonuclease domain-containing protein [Gammaproteobacteria bacterium]|nr:endonuclease domain-containing protein [Gammaproteobacteria bacterium]
MERLSPEERKLNAAAAHKARRGKIDTDEQVANRIAGSQGKPLSTGEVMVMGFLQESGVPGLEYNQLVGRWLIDLCDRSRKLAIEVDGGHWHSSPVKAEKDARKTRFLLANGWTILRIRDPNPAKLRALLQQVRELPVTAGTQH